MSKRTPASDTRHQLLERYLHSRSERQVRDPDAIPRRAPGEDAPLSYEQEQVWLHAQMAPDVPLYNEPLTIRYNGALDAAAMERCFNEIVRRHEIWRTSFQVVEGTPVQIVHPGLHVALPLVDLREYPAERRETEALRIAAEDARVPLDLTRLPLFRAKLVRIAAEDYRLYLTLSHMIFDGVAVYRVLLPEIASLYEAFRAGKPSPLPDPPIQYADYACWQRRTIQPEQFESQVEYWRRQLQGEMPSLEFPAVRPHDSQSAGCTPHLRFERTFRGAMHVLDIDDHVAENVRAFCKAHGFTVFHALLAGFAALLGRYTNERDIAVGSITAGRKHPQTEQLLGYFINTIVLRIDLTGDPTFTEIVSRTRDTTLAALEHDSVPFGYLLTQLGIERSRSRSPLFQVLFSLEVPMANVDPAWSLTQSDVDSTAAKYDLYIQLEEQRGRLRAKVQYSTDLFDADGISQMSTHWMTLLEGAMADPGRTLSSLPLLTKDERAHLAAWNATHESHPQLTLSELFESQVRRSPNAIAVVSGRQWLSYRELNDRANQLARHLRKMGIGPECLVGLCVDRSLEMATALLGILKAGAAYVPLDPALPRERLGMMIADAAPRAVLAQQAFVDRLPRDTQVIVLDPEWKCFEPESVANLPQGAQPENLAYVIYTSGSTGDPKGVEIPHRSLVNLLHSMQSRPGISNDDVLLSVSSLSFDIAGLEIYLPLISGARLVIAGSEVVRDPARLLMLLAECRPTIMQATPAMWKMLIAAGWPGSAALTILCGGEALPPTLAKELAGRGRAVWNLYGPTETTIWSTAHRVTGKESVMPIGSPIANTQIYVLDPDLNPAPAGVAGEIYISGIGVARGYRNRPELTAEKFLLNPVKSDSYDRIYKTGDLARRLPDGAIIFAGRNDNQIKLHGFRIELPAIEMSLAQHPAVAGAVADLRKQDDDARLTAYVIPRHRAEISPHDLRQFLQQKLPQYMVPSQFVFVDRFPLNSNGKVDRRVLITQAHKKNDAGERFAAPRDEIEKKLTVIWEDLLRVRPISRCDDFFDLGGHSLLAVRAAAHVEKAFGRRLPLSAFINAPTIESLAQLLREEKPERWFSFVPIQPPAERKRGRAQHQDGSRPPLFCMSSQFGDVLLYRPLAQRLGKDQPFFALQVLGEAGLPRRYTIEAIAAEYLKEVRKIQPGGPYFFVGYCFGGRVALEMAHQLISQGEDPPYLGIFATYHVPVRGVLERMRLHLRQFRAMGAAGKLFNAAGNFAGRIQSLIWRAEYGLFGHTARDSSGLFKNVAEMNLQGLRCYVPKTYPGRMAVFLSGKAPADFVNNSSSFRQYLDGMDARQVDLRLVPGEADSMFQEPFVSVLAERLRESLDSAPLPNAHQSSAA